VTLVRCAGCGILCAPGPRCPTCHRAWTRAYDRTRPAHHALYATAEWRRLSAEVRSSANRCHWCLKPSRRLVADHVIPLEQRPDLALDRGNLVAACVPCNTRRGRNAKIPAEPIHEPAAVRRETAHGYSEPTPAGSAGNRGGHPSPIAGGSE
jgi:hypothetical protein